MYLMISRTGWCAGQIILRLMRTVGGIPSCNVLSKGHLMCHVWAVSTDPRTMVISWQYGIEFPTNKLTSMDFRLARFLIRWNVAWTINCAHTTHTKFKAPNNISHTVNDGYKHYLNWLCTSLNKSCTNVFFGVQLKLGFCQSWNPLSKFLDPPL